ncbi:MAG: hypothetical protein CMO81_06005 [Waddliaceae bacterium]|nr:hypothetical protein [Waddliaceae bacterium]
MLLERISNYFKTNHVIILIMSYLSIGSFSAGFISPAMIHLQFYFNTSSQFTQSVVIIYLLGYLIGQLVYGHLSEKYSPIKLIKSGLLINLAGVLISLFSLFLSNFYLMLLGRFVSSIGLSSGLTCAFNLIKNQFSKEKSDYVLSWSLTSFTLSIFSSILIGSYLIYYTSVVFIFYALFLHGVLSCLSVFTLKDTKPKEATTKYTSPTTIHYWHLIKHSLLMGLFSAVGYCYFSSSAIYSMIDLGLDADAYGKWSILGGLGMILSKFVSDRLRQYITQASLILLSLAFFVMTLMSLQFFNLSIGENHIVYFVSVFFLFLLSGVMYPLAAQAIIRSSYHSEKVSGYMSFINLGSALIALYLMSHLPLSIIDSFIFVLLAFASLSFCIYFICTKHS